MTFTANNLYKQEIYQSVVGLKFYMLEFYDDIYIPLCCELDSTYKVELWLLASYSFRIRSTDLCEQE